MTWPALPIFLAVAGRPVVLVGEGEAAAAKRRVLERAGAIIVSEDHVAARIAIVIDDDDAVARLKARGVLVNAVDRPALCDFTLPAIVDRAPVLVAVGTGGASAGLAAALRQRIEAWLPPGLGALAMKLRDARDAIRSRFPDSGNRRRALGAALSAGGALDPLGAPDVTAWLAGSGEEAGEVVHIVLSSPDPDEITVRAARLLALADRVHHAADVPPAILDRARADAPRFAAPPSAEAEPGLTLWLEMAR